MQRADDDDLNVLEVTTEEIAKAVCSTIDRAWQVSQHATLLGLTRVLAHLALQHLRAHPKGRDAMLMMLRGIADLVEVETATKQ